MGSSPTSPIPYLKALVDLKNERDLKKQQQELEKVKKVQFATEQGLKIDSLGRVLTWASTESEWEERKELILNCGVNLTKFGWVGKAEKVTGLSRRIIEETIKHFDLKVFKRKTS